MGFQNYRSWTFSIYAMLSTSVTVIEHCDILTQSSMKTRKKSVLVVALVEVVPLEPLERREPLEPLEPLDSLVPLDPLD